MTQTDLEVGDPVVVDGSGPPNQPLPIGVVLAVHDNGRVSVSWPDGRSALPSVRNVHRAGPRLTVAPDPVPVTEPVRVTPGFDSEPVVTVQVPPEEFDRHLAEHAVPGYVDPASHTLADASYALEQERVAAERAKIPTYRTEPPVVDFAGLDDVLSPYYVPQPKYFTVGDPVNPAHYKSDPSGVECITITRHRNFNVGNAIKYLWRAGLKGADTAILNDTNAATITDLKKAAWYIQDEISRLEKEVS